MLRRAVGTGGGVVRVVEVGAQELDVELKKSSTSPRRGDVVGMSRQYKLGAVRENDDMIIFVHQNQTFVHPRFSTTFSH